MLRTSEQYFENLCIIPFAQNANDWEYDLFRGFSLCGEQIDGKFISFKDAGFQQVRRPAEIPDDGRPIYLIPESGSQQDTFRELTQLVNEAARKGYILYVQRVRGPANGR